MSSDKYEVQIDDFAEKRYLKGFRKRYKKTFEAPWAAFIFMLERFDLLKDRDGTNSITDCDAEVVIYKCEFKILSTESAKTSGNRCIVAQYKKKSVMKVLLVYCKNDVKGKNETKWWKEVVRENYSEFRELL